MPSADWKVEIVDSSGDADYSVSVVGDQVVTIAGAAPGDVLVVAPDGKTLITAPSSTPGAHAASHAAGGSDPVTLAESQITGLVTDLGNKQPLDADLTAIAGLATAADRLPYFTGVSAAALATFTAFGRSLVDDADASTARATLGLGTVATLGLDTDGTLAANSDSNIPSQKAVKAYADLMVPKTLFDANTILAATTDNTPVALTVAASTLLGRRAAGGIDAIPYATVLTDLGAAPLASPTFTGTVAVSSNLTVGPYISFTGASGIIHTDGSINFDGGIKWNQAALFQTTVGAAGAAAGLPAFPTKYAKIIDNAGVTYVVPCYAAS